MYALVKQFLSSSISSCSFFSCSSTPSLNVRWITLSFSCLIPKISGRQEGLLLFLISSQTEMRTHLNQGHKWVNPIWHLVWKNIWVSHFCRTLARRTLSVGLQRLIVLGVALLLFLTCTLISRTSSRQKPTGSARCDHLRQADQIASSHKKCNLWSITNVSFFSSSPTLCLTSAHNILTKSFFDGGGSHDSRKVAAQRGRERKREGQMRRWKLKNLSSSFILSDVKSENAKRRGFHTHSSFSAHSINLITWQAEATEGSSIITPALLFTP